MSKPYRDSNGRFAKKPKGMWIVGLLALAVIYGLLSFIVENIGVILIIVAAVAVVIVAVILLRRHLQQKDAAQQEAARQAEIARKKAEIAAKLYTCPHCGAETHGPACEYCGKPVK